MADKLVRRLTGHPLWEVRTWASSKVRGYKGRLIGAVAHLKGEA